MMIKWVFHGVFHGVQRVFFAIIHGVEMIGDSMGKGPGSTWELEGLVSPVIAFFIDM